jgi:predicted PurR-regulated permease PerM
MRLSDIAIDRTSAYFNYRIVLAMLSTVVHSLAFQSLGMPSAVALGLWVGVISQFIPAIGTYIAAFLPILVASTQDLRTTVLVVAFIVVYQQIENYLISPRLGRRALKVHPAVGFGAVLAGTAILGAVGAVLAVPMVAIIQSFAGVYVHRHEVIPEMRQEPQAASPHPRAALTITNSPEPSAPHPRHIAEHFGLVAQGWVIRRPAGTIHESGAAKVEAT